MLDKRNCSRNSPFKKMLCPFDSIVPRKQKEKEKAVGPLCRVAVWVAEFCCLV